MKKNTFLIFSFFCSIMAFSQPGQKKLSYSGTIADKFKIGMEFSIDAQNLSGRYSYRNHVEWLSLKGTITNSHIVLIEYNSTTENSQSGKITGTFEGTMQQDSTIQGIWRNHEGTKNLPFILTNERFNYSPDSMAIQVQQFSRCGCYEGTKFKILDEKISTMVVNKLVSDLNSHAAQAEKECPCSEENGNQLGTLQETSKIIYNRNNLLTCSEFSSGIGAHPGYDLRYKNYNLRTGELISFNEIFKHEVEQKIHQYIIEKLTTALESAKKAADEYGKGVLQGEGNEAIDREKSSSVYNYDFSLGKNGLVLHYDWGFPYVVQSLEPGDIDIPFDKLTPWIDPKGPLSFLLQK